MNTCRTARGASALALLALLASGSSGPASAQELKVEERTLSNGMKLLLLPRHDEPTIAGGWVAHVGSVNERPGITGISHLFEHMMFKGTPTIGTKDARRDLEIIEEQEKLRTQMRAEETGMRAALRKGDVDDITKPESKSPRYKELEAKFDELVKEQRGLLNKNEFSTLYQKAGGSGLNAFTNEDMTVYFITVPKNKLELWMWMESERLLRPVFREFYAERDVVYEERRLRVESTPTGRLEEAFDEMFWRGHPYTWPVIGYPSDLPNITKAQADDYFSLFYAPNNLTAVLVGDFDPKEAADLAERYFGRIARGKTAPPEMTTLPPKWEAEMRYQGEAETNPQIEARWHTVGFQHKDSYPLQVLAQLLNGRTGRLYKSMVLPQDAVATQAGAGQQTQKYAGSFSISAEVKDGKTPADVEGKLLGEVEKLQKELVPAEELQKVKNNFAAAAFRRLSSNFPIAVQLLSSDGFGDWREMNDGPKRIQAVTAEDVRRVAQKYFTKENRAIAVYTRKAGAPAPEPDDPAIANLPEETRNRIKATVAQVKASTNLDRLQGMVQQTEAALGNAPVGAKAGIEVVLKAAKARIEELKKK